MKRLRLQTAVGTMNLIAAGGADLTAKVLGITPEDVVLTTGVDAWVNTDRTRVRRVLDTYLFGMVDILGLPRFELPAEYVPAPIVTGKQHLRE